MYRIAHISDTHIRNLKFHKEYRQVFNQIYKTLREQKVDYIVHCGDLAHGHKDAIKSRILYCGPIEKQVKYTKKYSTSRTKRSVKCIQ